MPRVLIGLRGPLGRTFGDREVALTAHFGEPMLGNWDPVGVIVSLALAIGGVAIGT